jgi:selenocysteine insertion sequence-binding protein 2
VNLLFDRAEAEGGDAGRVGVDLIYLEDEDEDDDDEEDEADDGEERAEKETDEKETAVDETEDASDKSSAAAAAPDIPDCAETEPGAAADPEPSPVSFPSNPWAVPGGFKNALLRAETADAEAGGASDETKKKKRKPKAPRAPGDGPREKGATRLCETCGVSCSGDDAWADHLKGKTHAKNERRREREREAEANGGSLGDARRDEQKKGNAHTFIGADAEIRYADQIISSETNAATVSCVSELKRFQDRAYHQDAVKAKMRRRLVFGLREVAKAVQLKKAKAVVVAPNIEEVGLEGGLDDVVAAIIEQARGNGTPVVFALTRNRLGQIVGKRLRISAMAVLDQSGADEQFKAMLAAAAAGRAAFKEEAERKKEKEKAEAARAGTDGRAFQSGSSGSDDDGNTPSLNPAASTFVPRARATAS